MTSHEKASQAEPEGYSDHLDSIELRVVRMPAEAAARIAGLSPAPLGVEVDGVRFIRAPRRSAPPLNPLLGGIVAMGRVAGAGTAALVPKLDDEANIVRGWE